MARRSLRASLNQIRTWVRQGRTDAWVAHQLEVSTSQLRDFKRQHDLEAGDEPAEVDLRDEIEAEIEAAVREAAAAEEAAGEEPEAEQAAEAEAESEPGGDADADDEEGEGTGRRRRRRRRRRGGSGTAPAELQGVFDHGDEDGYGLWLDPAVKDNPVYTQHWAQRRKLRVRVEADKIVLEPDEG